MLVFHFFSFSSSLCTMENVDTAKRSRFKHSRGKIDEMHFLFFFLLSFFEQAEIYDLLSSPHHFLSHGGGGRGGRRGEVKVQHFYRPIFSSLLPKTPPLIHRREGERGHLIFASFLP